MIFTWPSTTFWHRPEGRKPQTPKSPSGAAPEMRRFSQHDGFMGDRSQKYTAEQPNKNLDSAVLTEFESVRCAALWQNLFPLLPDIRRWLHIIIPFHCRKCSLAFQDRFSCLKQKDGSIFLPPLSHTLMCFARRRLILVNANRKLILNKTVAVLSERPPQSYLNVNRHKFVFLSLYAQQHGGKPEIYK